MANQVRFKASLDDKVSSQLDKIRDKFNQVGGKGTAASLFGNVGAMAAGAALVGVGRAAEAAAGFLSDSIDMASNMNETLAKSSVVFGSNADDIEDWGSTAAKSFGTSKNEAIGAAASFADLFNTVGLGKAPAQEMSTNLVELAADLASFHNVAGGSPEVLEKLRSGLSGEAEPMRRLGVFLSETKVKAKAMEMGLGDAHGELTEGEKIIARYNIILDETKSAQGDFARTAGELANKQRTANAVLEDAQTVLGEKLLPAQLSVTNAQLDFFQGVTALADAIGGKMTPESIALTVALGGMTEAEAAAEIATQRTAAAAIEAAESYTEYEGKRGLWVHAAKEIAETLPEELEKAKAAAVAIANRTPQDIANGLREKRTAWQQAVDLLKSDITNAMSRTAEIANIKGVLIGDQLRRGLKSKDPVIRAQAVATREILLGRLKEMGGDASTWGANFTSNLAKGMRSRIEAVQRAGRLLATAQANYLKYSSPAKKGPGSEGGGPEGWARHFVDLYARGMAPGAVERASANLAGASVSAFASGGIARTAGSSVVGGTKVIQLVVDGRVLAEVVDKHQYRSLQRAAPTLQRA